jgi:hypothetical protein
MDDLRSEIRASFEKEQAGLAPGAALRRDIVAAVTTRPRRESNFQWLAVAAAVVLGILVVAGLMSTRLAHRANLPAPAATAPAASPSATPSELASPSPSPTPISVAAAESLIRATVTGARPLLLPAIAPTYSSAQITYLSSSSFTVTYTSRDGTQSVTFAIVVANPPPPGSHGSQANPNFRGDRRSLYQVDDTTQATSSRFLIWNEPGAWSEPNGLPGVPYYLRSEGLTDAEFWSIANSLRA